MKAWLWDAPAIIALAVLPAFFLKELPDQEQRQVESHVRSCQSCYEELDRLRVMEAALMWCKWRSASPTVKIPPVGEGTAKCAQPVHQLTGS